MMYVDANYINMARSLEVDQHEHNMDQLRAKIAQLTKAVTWETEQHDSRLKELQQAEDTLTMSDSPTPSMSTPPTIEPISSSRHHWTHSRKFVHHFEQKHIA